MFQSLREKSLIKVQTLVYGRSVHWTNEYQPMCWILIQSTQKNSLELLFQESLSSMFLVSVKKSFLSELWKTEEKKLLIPRGSCLPAYGHWQKAGIWNITLRIPPNIKSSVVAPGTSWQFSENYSPWNCNSLRPTHLVISWKQESPPSSDCRNLWFLALSLFLTRNA